jgi:polar amino acid transport system substrate-binding protein
MNFRKLSFLISLLLIIPLSSVKVAATPDLTFHVIAAQPFGYIDDDGEPTGLHYELVQQLSIRSGIVIRPVIMPYNRIWVTLENGGHDGGIVWRSEERDSLVHYLSFVWTDYLTALTLKGQEITSYPDLHQVEVGVMTSSSISDAFNKDDKINKVFIAKYENAVTMLAAKRIDAVVGNLFAYLYIANRQGVIDELSLPGYYMGQREQWLQLSRKSKKLLALSADEQSNLIEKLSTTMTAMVADGTIRQLNNKYYGQTVNRVSDLLKAVSP